MTFPQKDIFDNTRTRVMFKIMSVYACTEPCRRKPVVYMTTNIYILT